MNSALHTPYADSSFQSTVLAGSALIFLLITLWCVFKATRK